MWDFFMQRKSIEPAGADKLVILFFFGIMVGSIIANLIPFSWVQAMNVWSADYITAFMSKAVKYSTMFRYLLRIRGLIMIGLFLVMMTPFARKLLYIIPVYIGAAWGMISSIILMEHGINGIRICFFLLFPHFIFYAAGIIMMLYKILRRTVASKGIDLTFLLVFLFAAMMIVAGIMAESYVNVSVMPWVLEQMA